MYFEFQTMNWDRGQRILLFESQQLMQFQLHRLMDHLYIAQTNDSILHAIRFEQCFLERF